MAGDQLYPNGIVADQATGALYVGDMVYVSGGSFSHSRILQYTSTGIASTYTGGPYVQSGSSGDGGPASQAVIVSGGVNMTTDAVGDLYFTDHYAVREINASTGIITRFAGAYASCQAPTATVGALATSVKINPNAIATDPLTGNIYVADACTSSILAITPSGSIVSMFSVNPVPTYQMAFDTQGRLYWGGNNYVAWKVLRMDRTGAVTTVAGTNNFYEGYSGDGGPATSAQLGNITGIAINPAGDVYIATGRWATIRRIDTNGIITTLNPVGVNSSGFQGDGGPVSNARFYSPGNLSLDSWGDLYVSDQLNYRVRMIAPSAQGAAVDGNATISSISGGSGDSAGGEQNGGDNPSELCAQNCDADVNTATGEYTETTDDLKIPGRGLPLDFSRT